MPASVEALLAFLVAGIVTLLLVPSTIRLARRGGGSGLPGVRSLHEVPTPKVGGLAIFAGVLIAALVWLPWDAETRAILAGAVAITAIGVLDDVYDLGAATKLIGQTVAVVIPVTAGVTVESFTFPFLGQLNPGSADLLGLPGGGPISFADLGPWWALLPQTKWFNLIAG